MSAASWTRLIFCAVGHTNDSLDDGDTGESIVVLIRTRVGGAAQRVSISEQTLSASNVLNGIAVSRQLERPADEIGRGVRRR
jgi:hypothetical protein